MKTDVDFSLYLVHFFLEREMFQATVVEKIKTRFFMSKNFFYFRKS